MIERTSFKNKSASSIIYIPVPNILTFVFVATVTVYRYIPTERVLCVLFSHAPVSAMALFSLYYFKLIAKQTAIQLLPRPLGLGEIPALR